VRHAPQRPPGLPDVEHNFGALIAELAQRLHEAAAEESDRRTHRRTDRIVRAFLRDYPDAASRDAVDQVLRDIEASLEDSLGDESVQLELIALRREFQLNTDPLTPVADFDDFRRRLGELGVQRRIGYREAATTTGRVGRRGGRARRTAEGTASGYSCIHGPLERARRRLCDRGGSPLSDRRPGSAAARWSPRAPGR
jgi:hypothetical protein